MSLKTRLFGDGGNRNKFSLYNAGDIIAISVFYINQKNISDEQHLAQTLVNMVRLSCKLPNIRFTDKTVIRTSWKPVRTGNLNYR